MYNCRYITFVNTVGYGTYQAPMVWSAAEQGVGTRYVIRLLVHVISAHTLNNCVNSK